MNFDELVALIKQNGIVGAGGAGFPTYAKLDKRADTIILNCAECEPLLKLHRQLLERYAYEILSALDLIAKTVGAKDVIIGVKGSYKGAIEAVEEYIASFEETPCRECRNRTVNLGVNLDHTVHGLHLQRCQQIVRSIFVSGIGGGLESLTADECLDLLLHSGSVQRLSGLLIHGTILSQEEVIQRSLGLALDGIGGVVGNQHTLTQSCLGIGGNGLAVTGTLG